jgi:hypothetical protein
MVLRPSRGGNTQFPVPPKSVFQDKVRAPLSNEMVTSAYREKTRFGYLSLIKSHKVFLSVQKHSFLETSIWTWTFALDPKLGGKKMASEKAEKCAHPLCSCVTTSGKYCSAECEATVKTPEIACACPHAGCKGKTH